MKNHPTSDDPLGLISIEEKLRMAELRTLLCVSDLLHYNGEDNASALLKARLQLQDPERYNLAAGQVAACMNKVIEDVPKLREAK